jgi:hypothetical protein
LERQAGQAAIPGALNSGCHCQRAANVSQ